VRIVSSTLIAVTVLCGPICAMSEAQPPLFADPAPPTTAAPASPVVATPPPVGAAPGATAFTADAANIDGCQVIARIDGQIVLACEVLWHVNKIIEQNRSKIPPEQEATIRQELLRRELGGLIDRKLLYAEFRRNVPTENLPRIEENLIGPFEEREIPVLLKQLEVSNSVELERELVRLGSSLADVRQAFNEKAIAGEWIRTKVVVNEEVSPDEMLAFYQSHLANYEHPAKVRWEELMVHKSRYPTPAEAYAAIAVMGNEVFQRAAADPVRGPAFAEVAKVKSDGYTAKEGGLKDWTDQGSLRIKAIDEALFTLEVGQMSPIIEDDDAFYIVRVLERKAAGRQPFTEVQGKIREDLKDERFQQAVEKFLTKLRGQASVWTAFTGNIAAEELIGRKPNGPAPR
jgi:hypothetical protein